MRLDELEAALSRIRERAYEENKRHLVALAELRAEEARVESEILALRKRDRLHAGHSVRNVPKGYSTKMNSVSEDGRRRGGRRTTSKHPFPMALDAAGTNAAEWGRDHGLTREQVKSWYAPLMIKRGDQIVPNDAVRPIPDVFAELIEIEFGIPATIESWPQGIRPAGRQRLRKKKART